MRYFFVLIFIAASVFSQPIQEYKVRDFSGGLVNSLSNALMQDNQSLVLENYDIINGKLRRRPGLTTYHNTGLLRYPIQALLPYVAPQIDKDLLVLMGGNYFPFNSADSNISAVRICNEALSICTTLVVRHPGFYGDRRNQNTPYNVNSAVINNRLIFAVANSEMRIWDGNKMSPARPRSAGQPYAIPLDGSGKMNGIFQYRILPQNNSVPPKYGDLSPPSWPVRVKDGNVFVGDMGPFISGALQDSAWIYRSKNGGPYQKLKQFDDAFGGNGVIIVGLDGYYIDTTKETLAADSLPFPWGYHTNCIFGTCGPDSVLAFGEMRALQKSGTAAAGYGVTRGLKGLTDSTCVCFVYSVVFRDSSGRQSYASPPTCLCYSAAILRGAGGNGIKDSLLNIPIPRDSGIVNKLLLRGLFGSIVWRDSSAEKLSRLHPCYVENSSIYRVGVDGGSVSWISPSSGTTGAMAVDSMTSKINNSAYMSSRIKAEDSGSFIHIRSAVPGQTWKLTAERFCKGASGLPSFVYGEELKQNVFQTGDYLYNFVILDTLDDTVTTYIDSIPYDSLLIIPWCKDSSNAQQPEKFCYDDSAITFQPFDIAYHGDRLFAIGDLEDKNVFWYSDFGRPTTMPPDHFIAVESQLGDWFVRLLSVGDNLLLFRQNSIYGLSGLSFFQFNLEKLVSGVGLSAPRTLTVNKNLINFLHESGAYEMSMAGGLSNPTISWVIKNSLDSIGTNLRRSVAKPVGDDWWLSVPIDSTAVDSTSNNQTYIYSRTPTPHWKSYSFGIKDIVLFDKDTLALDYATDKFIFVSGTDSLFQWGDKAIDLDNGQRIISKYQSKYFFHEGEGPIRREKIFYVDFFGKHIVGGLDDTLMVTFYEESKGAVDSVKFVPKFRDRKVDRVTFNRISDNCSIGWRAYGLSEYEITGFTIGFLAWDDGIRR